VPVADRSLHIRRLTAKYTRWLHIYGSMLSFGLVFFFAVTGLTLNHPQWFEKHQRTRTIAGAVDAALTHTPTDADVNKLGIVEQLRSANGITGALSDFRIDDRECELTFKGPGYSADVFIDRATGHYEVTERRMGLGALMNDLHKGRDTGAIWRWFIDVSAVMLVFVSLTGLVLIWFVHRHRTAALLSLAAACLACYVIYLAFVP
jgi:hypothetical protein